MPSRFTFSFMNRFFSKSLRYMGLTVLCLASLPVMAERLKELVSVQGVRQNQLLGYGLVVGLDGTGDQSPFTVQSVISMLQQLGVNLPPGVSLQAKNVAGVVVTTSMPAFTQPGQTLDVTVSSLGSSKSLRGGTLLMTPLKGADGQIYAMAQGNVLVGGVGATGAGGTKAQVNHLSAGRISAGATVEKEIATVLGQNDFVVLELRESDFNTVSRIVETINNRYGQGRASAQNGRVIHVKAPLSQDERVTFLGDLELIQVRPAPMQAKVILNGRTGSIVMNQTVTLDACAVAHGALSIVVSTQNSVSQPSALSSGQTALVQNSTVDIQKETSQLVHLQTNVLLSDVVKGLNTLGVSPQDLLAILQAMKAAGALRAELEVI